MEKERDPAMGLLEPDSKEPDWWKISGDFAEKAQYDDNLELQEHLQSLMFHDPGGLATTAFESTARKLLIRGDRTSLESMAIRLWFLIGESA